MTSETVAIAADGSDGVQMVRTEGRARNGSKVAAALVRRENWRAVAELCCSAELMYR